MVIMSNCPPNKENYDQPTNQPTDRNEGSYSSNKNDDDTCMYVYCIGLTIKLALITCTTPVDCVEEGLGVVLQPHRQVVHLPGLACHTQLYKQGVH